MPLGLIARHGPLCVRDAEKLEDERQRLGLAAARAAARARPPSRGHALVVSRRRCQSTRAESQALGRTEQRCVRQRVRLVHFDARPAQAPRRTPDTAGSCRAPPRPPHPRPVPRRRQPAATLAPARPSPRHGRRSPIAHVQPKPPCASVTPRALQLVDAQRLPYALHFELAEVAQREIALYQRRCRPVR